MNWGPGPQGGFYNALAMGQNAGNNFMQAFQQGRQVKAQRDERNALAAYAKDPNEANFAGLADVRPDIAIPMRQQQAAAAAAAEKDARERKLKELPVMVQLLENSKDPASYQQNIGLAKQYGFDVSGVPEQFDPNWVAQTASGLKMLSTPEGQEAYSTAGKQALDEGMKPGTSQFQARVTELVNAEQRKTIPFQPGGNVVVYDTRTGETKPLVLGQGGAAAPASEPTAVNPQTGETVVFRNGAWVPMQGGGVSNGPGSF